MVWKRLHRDDSDFLMLIVGARGSGKSTGAVRMCELVDPNFTIDNVVFSPEQFSDLLSSGRLVDGSAILFDEIGVGANSREWYSMGNRLLNSSTQVSRTLHLFCVFTTLDEAKVDNQIKKNFTSICETDGIDKLNQVGWLKIGMLQVNPQNGEVYHKYWRFFNEKNQMVRYSRIGVHLPSKHLFKAYLEKRREMARVIRGDMQKSIKTGVYTKFGKDFKKKVERVKEQKQDLTKIAQQIVQLGTVYKLTAKRKGWNNLKIIDDFKLSYAQVRLVVQAANEMQQQ